MPNKHRSRHVSGEGPQEKEKHGLFLLHPLNDTGHAEVDIIAVHGLGGDAFRTWTEDNRKLWLRDFLPTLVPKSRIMTFGYDSNWAFSRSVAGIEEFASDLLNRLRNKRWSIEAMNRPLIFICHSLGGIVCKKALLLSQEQPFYANILEKTRGIIFFGTPHRGSRIASWAQVMSNYVNACLFHSPMRAKLLKDLEPNSDALAIISSSFKFVVSKIQIITFYETEIMLPLKGLVVEKESAVLGISNERTIPIAADHRNMVKFTHYESHKFESVHFALQELITGPPEQRVPPETLPYAMEAFTVTDYFFHLASVPTRVPGTCEWVASHASFQNWQSTSESDMLWLRGNPGVGKTVLAKYLIESVIPSRRVLPKHIESEISEETGGDVLTYFFCNDKDMERKLESNILKTILHQLLTLEPSLIGALRPRVVQTNWDFVNHTAGLWAALEDAILAAKNRTIYIVLDALDEMDYGQLESFTAAIGKLAESVGPHIAPRQLKVLVTSRPEPEIEQNLCCASIAVRSERDVKYFVTKLVDKFAAYHDFPLDLTEKIINILALKAGNMFLWVDLAWRGFREGITIWSRQRVEERLQSLELLPPGLEGLYESILSRYSSTTLKQLINVFSWLIAITRPMTAREFEVAVALNEDTISMKNLDIGFSMNTQVNKICPNLLRINSTNHVQFDHQSFKDFLLSPTTNPRYRINILEAHAKIAVCCLRCFTFDDLDAGLIRDRVSDQGLLHTDTLAECELLRYAAKNWPYHVQSAARSTHIWDAYQRLYSRRNSFGLWWVLYRYDDRFSRAHMTCYAETLLPLPLHIAVTLNIRYFVEKFISSGVDVNQRESPRHDQKGFFSSGHAGGTVLHFDSLDSHMIRYLVANGADISIRDYDGDTPLHSALRRRKEQLCCDLLDCSPADADLNVRDKSGNTLLHVVVDGQYPLVLSKLLDDPRFDLAGFDALTPLELACTWGNKAIVRVLLASSRVIEAQRENEMKEPSGMSLLFLVILQGWPDLALEVMEKLPSDFEQELDKDQRTILHHAVMEHWHDILDKYLDRTKSARLNKMDKNGMTPLHLAAKGRNGYAATRLLDSGAQSGIQDHQGRSPLHTAAEAGSERVLKLLLDRGNVDVTEIDNEKRTVLHHVATWDLAPIAQRLVALPNVDVNAKDRHGRTAAHLASMFGCPAVLAALLNLNKIDVNAADHYGNTILHCAVDGGSEVCITRLLWRSGLEINAMNRYGKTPMDVTYNFANDARAQDIRNLLRENGAKKGLWRPPPRPYAYRSTSAPTTESEIEDRTGDHDRTGWQLVAYNAN